MGRGLWQSAMGRMGRRILGLLRAWPLSFQNTTPSIAGDSDGFSQNPEVDTSLWG